MSKARLSAACRRSQCEMALSETKFLFPVIISISYFNKTDTMRVFILPFKLLKWAFKIAWLQTQILLKSRSGSPHTVIGNRLATRTASRLTDVDMQRLYSSSLPEHYLFSMHQYCGDVRSYRAGKPLDIDSRLANCQPAVQPDWIRVI